MVDAAANPSLSQNAQIGLIGFPIDFNSSYLPGAAKAPPRIREALYSDSSNLFCENGLNLGDPLVYSDYGDIDVAGSQDFIERIEGAILDIMNEPLLPLSIGGDHSITYPIIKAMNQRYPNLTILQFDAHPDLYDEFNGSSLSHACPFARIMEKPYADRLIQVGVRCMTRDQQEQAARFDAEIVSMKAIQRGLFDKLPGPLYISYDMDVLDPAFAPGVSHQEPGGLSVRQALEMIQELRAPVVGADIVEYNPDRDIHGMTAMAAAKILKEISAKMLDRAYIQ